MMNEITDFLWCIHFPLGRTILVGKRSKGKWLKDSNIYIFVFICSSVAADKHWQSLMSSLVNECLSTADIVAPVITSESPEGLNAEDAQGNSPEWNEFSVVRVRR